MRVVQAGHFQLRKYGRPKVSTELKLLNGFVRLNHNVQIFSERDTAAFEAPFGWRDLRKGKANKRLVETCQNFQPDLLVLGHCDIIRNETLDAIRKDLPDLRIAYRNVDALYTERNAMRIRARAPFVDHLFLTTAGEESRNLADDPAKVSYIPNPVDAAIEIYDNSQKPANAFERDLFFAGQGDADLPRLQMARTLKEELGSELRFDTFGFDGAPAIWGSAYDRVLATTKMGLSLNRQEGAALSSSARIAQLLGNGILAFVHRSSGLDRFFRDRAVFFESHDDLRDKVRHYHANDGDRRRISSAGHDYCHREMSSERVGQFIIDRTFGHAEADNYPWSDV